MVIESRTAGEPSGRRPRRAPSKRRRLPIAGLAVAIIGLATACQPDIPTSPPPCYVSDFTMTAQELVNPVETSIDRQTIWVIPGGSIRFSASEGTSSVAVDEQLVARGAFTGRASLHATASGTLTATDTTLTFSVTALAGSGHVFGYEHNYVVKKDVQLPGSYLDDLAGLQGQADYTCSPNGLSLSFDSLHINFVAVAVVAAP